MSKNVLMVETAQVRNYTTLQTMIMPNSVSKGMAIQAVNEIPQHVVTFRRHVQIDTLIPFHRP